MTTLGWILILAAVIIGRAVYKGRVFQMGEDLSDTILALIQGDTAKLQEVLNRTGDSNQPSELDLNTFIEPTFRAGVETAPAIGETIQGSLGQLQGKLNASVALAAMMLGEKAKGYRWGASGPDYYDCSGLMWKAMLAAGAYKGNRFTTDSFPKMVGSNYRKVTGPIQIDDILLWPFRVPYATGHMGVANSQHGFYSARSVKSGIGVATIKGYRSYEPHIYRRVK